MPKISEKSASSEKLADKDPKKSETKKDKPVEPKPLTMRDQQNIIVATREKEAQQYAENQRKAMQAGQEKALERSKVLARSRELQANLKKFLNKSDPETILKVLEKINDEIQL